MPEAGWGVTSGVRAGHAPISGQYPASATVEDGALKFTVRTGPFHGDADQLVDQIEATSDALNQGRGSTSPAARHDRDRPGKQGATVRVTGPHTAGLIAAFILTAAESKSGDRTDRRRPRTERSRAADDRQHQRVQAGQR